MVRESYSFSPNDIYPKEPFFLCRTKVIDLLEHSSVSCMKEQSSGCRLKTTKQSERRLRSPATSWWSEHWFCSWRTEHSVDLGISHAAIGLRMMSHHSKNKMEGADGTHMLVQLILRLSSMEQFGLPNDPLFLVLAR